jgi:ribosome biogenesis protein ERB1
MPRGKSHFETEEESEPSVYDSLDDAASSGVESEDDDDEDEFEAQGSSDEEENDLREQAKPDDDDPGLELQDTLESAYEQQRAAQSPSKNKSLETNALTTHTDHLSSDEEDEEGNTNRIGRVPIHWYADYDHVGYNVHGDKTMKSASLEEGDRLDRAISKADSLENNKFVVHDVLNDRSVVLSSRQLELIRRIQGGAYAHPEFDGNPDYIDYFSSIPEESGLSSNRTEPKARFQPSHWEKLQVNRLLEKLKRGDINMDYLAGKIRDMNEVRNKRGQDSDKPGLMWTGAEEDELNMRKGPQAIPPPKVKPPGHAESYRPPEEYLPTEDDLKEWAEMEANERPYGRLVPKQFPNLRSVGAYEHAVTDTFERCLDLYLCPRLMKRRLNIDPESLVPRLPKANDLRPFPTAKCIEYRDQQDDKEEVPLVRCLSPSPDGQFLASGGSDGVVRIWEVQTGRLLCKWNLSKLILENGFLSDTESDAPKAVVSLQWNPNRRHHCLVAAVGVCVVVVATGTAGAEDAEITAALLSAARKGGHATNERAAKAVQWKTLVTTVQLGNPISSSDSLSGPIALVCTNRNVSSVRWHAKGDYFVSVSPKAQSAAVLIHQLSKGNSQQPFSKAKGEAQLACFHPTRPFLFVSSQHHIRVYHLVKQSLVKRK